MVIGKISVGGEDYGKLWGLRVTVLEQSFFVGCDDTYWLRVELSWAWPSFRPLMIERDSRAWRWLEA